MTTVRHRTAAYPIDPLFLERWSSRSFTGEPVSRDELFTVLEAARWAPSSYNSQPWRFIYAHRDSTHWPALFGLLNTFNRSWASKAAAIVVIVSKSTFAQPGKAEAPARTHSFDAGAAWASLALQAARSGLMAHGIGGFDYDTAREVLGIPADYRVEIAVAIGRPEPVEFSSATGAGHGPSGRTELAALAFEGRFAEF